MQSRLGGPSGIPYRVKLSIMLQSSVVIERYNLSTVNIYKKQIKITFTSKSYYDLT